MQIFHKKEIEKKLCVKLCYVVEKKAEQNLKKIIIPEKTEPIVKKQIPKKVKIEKEKKIPAPVVKNKTVPKKEIVQEIKKIQEVYQEVREEVVEEKTIEDSPYEEVIKEDQYARAKRVNKEYIDNNIQKIVKLLSDNLYYPRSARKRGITGEVTVKFRLSTEAHVNSVEIIASQSDILSRAAVKTIEDLSGKFPKPQEELLLEVPINYELKNL